MIVKAKGPSGPAKIHSDDPKHALGLVQYLRTIGYKAWIEDTNGNEIGNCPEERDQVNVPASRPGPRIACVVFIDNIWGAGIT
jgi:hypothetical protein